MKLKVLFKGDKSYLATEQGEIIENVSIVGTDIQVEWMEEPADSYPASKNISIMSQQLLMQIKFEGQVGVIPTDVEGSVESNKQLLIENK